MIDFLNQLTWAIAGIVVIPCLLGIWAWFDLRAKNRKVGEAIARAKGLDEREIAEAGQRCADGGSWIEYYKSLPPRNP